MRPSRAALKNRRMTRTIGQSGPAATAADPPSPERNLRQRLRRWTSAPAYAGLTGGALTLFAVVELLLVPGSAITAFAVLVCTASLTLRAAHPAVGLLTVGAALLGFATDGNMAYATVAGLLMGCYTLGRHRVQHPAVLVTAGSLAALTVNLVHIDRWARDGSPGLPVLQGTDRFSLGLYAETLVLTVAIMGAVSAGDAVRAREETRRTRAAAQSRLLAMERRQAAEAERAAIARELHDMIAHSVSMIAVRAESATYTTPDLSPPARDAFQEIAATARSSMAELRRLLGCCARAPTHHPPSPPRSRRWPRSVNSSTSIARWTARPNSESPVRRYACHRPGSCRRTGSFRRP